MKKLICLICFLALFSLHADPPKRKPDLTISNGSDVFIIEKDEAADKWYLTRRKNDGKQVWSHELSVPGSREFSASDLAIGADGSAYVLGNGINRRSRSFGSLQQAADSTARSSPLQFAVIKINLDGTPATFGNGGVKVFDSSSERADSAQCLAVHSDGSIAVSSEKSSKATIYRLKPNGDVVWRQTVSEPELLSDASRATASSLAFDAKGDIILSGTATLQDTSLQRLRANRRKEAAYGAFAVKIPAKGGKVKRLGSIYFSESEEGDQIFSVATDPNQEHLILARQRGEGDTEITRFDLSSGRVDESLGPQVVESSLGTNAATGVRALKMGADGSLFVMGRDTHDGSSMQVNRLSAGANRLQSTQVANIFPPRPGCSQAAEDLDFDLLGNHTLRLRTYSDW